MYVVDPSDEDVDVGGDEMSEMNFLSVYIEKDTKAFNIKCSSSSSLSSVFGSSSRGIVLYYENSFRVLFWFHLFTFFYL